MSRIALHGNTGMGQDIAASLVAFFIMGIIYRAHTSNHIPSVELKLATGSVISGRTIVLTCAQPSKGISPALTRFVYPCVS